MDRTTTPRRRRLASGHHVSGAATACRLRGWWAPPRGAAGLRAVVTLAVVLVAGVCAAAPPRLNVLLFCVDDLKPALGCYGDAAAKTPHIDRLASRGVRFASAYCNQAVCSPSRNALLVGLRPQSLGIYDLATHFRTAAPDAVTLPQHFRAAGYRTEALGKVFHVGHGNREDDASWDVPHFKAKTVHYALPEHQGPSREAARFDNRSPEKLPKGAPTESADVPDDTYADGRLAAEAVRRLTAFAATDGATRQPFFMAVGFVKPHLPFVAPKRYWDLHDPARLPQPAVTKPPAGAPDYAPQFGGELRQYSRVPDDGPIPADLTRHLIHGYYAATSYMDACLGRVLDALDATGLADETIVVLWGDHGWHLGDHGMWCKHTNYEQATRIPLIVVVPGGPRGAASAALVESVDIYPTLAGLAGLPTPRAIDGRSFAAVLADPAAAARDHVIHVYPRRERLGRAVRTDTLRLVEWRMPEAGPETAELELYDYAVDPLETTNVAAERPADVARLRALLDKQPPPRPQIKPDRASRAGA